MWILGHPTNENMWMLGHEGGTSMFPKHGPYQAGLPYEMEVKVTGCWLFPGLAPWILTSWRVRSAGSEQPHGLW